MRKKVIIVGSGPSALMLACELDASKYEAHLYERNAAAGRKFLVAGDGGLNLTHSEKHDSFLERYTPADFLKKAFYHFSNQDLVNWFNQNGLKTFVGSSGRVFPEKNIKPIEVLNIFLEIIKKKKFQFFFGHTWTGFSEQNNLLFETKDDTVECESDVVVFCLGGASWPVTGSKGEWLNVFLEKQIQVKAFESSNASFLVSWPQKLVSKIEGKALKNISISCAGKKYSGEIVLTKTGIEGSGIYPLSPEIRGEIKRIGLAEIKIDFKPTISRQEILKRITSPNSGINYTRHLANVLNLSDLQIHLLKMMISKEDFLRPEILVEHIKEFKIKVNALGEIQDAISTVGGISLSEVDENFELKKMPGVFVLGEMLDYDAPTGGYLLQSCFSMGKFLSDYLNKLI